MKAYVASTMLPEYDPTLDVANLDIFQPVQTLLPKLSKGEFAVTLQQEQEQQHSQQQQQQQQRQQQKAQTQKASTVKPVARPTANTPKKNIANNDSYCKACKKKFSSQATFDNHLKSAKHIANEKKLIQQKKASTPSASVESVESEVSANQNADVLEASSKLTKLKEALNSSTALTTETTVEFSQLSRQLFKLKRPRDTEESLRLLVDALSKTAVDSVGQQSGNCLLLTQAQLALARLLYLYRQLDNSRSIYLNMIERIFNTNRTELLQLIEEAKHLRIDGPINRCTSFSASVVERANLAESDNILNLLLEAGHIFAQPSNTFGKIATGHMAAGLYAIGLFIAEKAQLPIYRQSFRVCMFQHYSSLGNQQHRLVDLYLLDGTGNARSLFESLLLSLEIDDLVRAKRIVAIIREQTPLVNYFDVQFVLDVYESLLTAVTDNEPLLQKYEHLQLLLNAMADEPLLLLRSELLDVQKQTMLRLEKLIHINK